MLNINLFSGIVLLILAISLIYKNPNLLAYFIFLNIPYIGSNISASLRKIDLTILGFISSFLLGMIILSVGLSYQGILYFVMSGFQFVVHNFVLKDRYLAKLFGYPHFSAALAKASLATLDANGISNVPYTADENKDKRERLTTKNTSGIRNITKSSEMDVISLDNLEISLPDKSKRKKKSKPKNINVTAPILSETTAPEIDVLSLEKPAEPTPPKAFNPQEYSAAIENEMKIAMDMKIEMELDKADEEHDDNISHFNEKKETYSDYLDKKSILLADKNTEDTDDIDLLF